MDLSMDSAALVFMNALLFLMETVHYDDITQVNSVGLSDISLKNTFL